MKKTFIGMFHEKTDVLSAISRLERKGVAPEDIYLVTADELIAAEIRSETSQKLKSTPSSFIGKVVGIVSNEDRVKHMVDEAGFSKEDAPYYVAQVMKGSFLLYMDGRPADDSVFETAIDESRYGGYEPLAAEEIEAVKAERVEK